MISGFRLVRENVYRSLYEMYREVIEQNEGF